MGFFAKPEGAPLTSNAPLSRDRIEACLKAHEWHYSIDSDGDIGGIWDNKIFYFFLMGEKKEILQVRGRWHRSLPATAEAQIIAATNEFNRDKIWPKAYTRIEDDKLGVYSEVSTDLEYGVADDQLSQLIECGLFTGLRFFEFLDEKFPETGLASDPATAIPPTSPTGPAW